MEIAHSIKGGDKCWGIDDT